MTTSHEKKGEGFKDQCGMFQRNLKTVGGSYPMEAKGKDGK